MEGNRAVNRGEKSPHQGAVEAPSTSYPALIVDGTAGKRGMTETLAALLRWTGDRAQAVAIASELSQCVSEAGFEPDGRVAIFDDCAALVQDRGRVGGIAPGLVLCLGGDGALLIAVRRFHELQLPFLGVNLGSVGFNASVAPQHLIETLEAWEAGETDETGHMTLQVRLLRAGEEVARGMAINEASIHRELDARMLDIDVRQGDTDVLSCHADGLIVATPTGSTAYNLSAGGPILHPSLECLVVTGLGAHTLSNRSIVLPLDRPLTLQAHCRSSVAVSGKARSVAALILDGQERWTLLEGDRIEVGKGPDLLRLIRPKGTDYFATLRAKLNWNVPIKPPR